MNNALRTRARARAHACVRASASAFPSFLFPSRSRGDEDDVSDQLHRPTAAWRPRWLVRRAIIHALGEVPRLRATTQHIAAHNMRRYVDETWSESGGRVGWSRPMDLEVGPHQLAITGHRPGTGSTVWSTVCRTTVTLLAMVLCNPAFSAALITHLLA